MSQVTSTFFPKSRTTPSPTSAFEKRMRRFARVSAKPCRAKVRSLAPGFFERLFLDLLHAVGYGTEREDLTTRVAARTAERNGVISFDRRGLKKVYVEAKRYAEDDPVRMPMI